jgi:hypothetical protein
MVKKTTTTSPGQIYKKSVQLAKKGTASTKKWYTGTGRPAAIKLGKSSAKSYAKYGKPSVTLGKRLLKWGVVKPAKLALRFPGVGLAATAAYYGAKHIGTKAGKKKFQYPIRREFDKRGRKFV